MEKCHESEQVFHIDFFKHTFLTHYSTYLYENVYIAEICLEESMSQNFDTGLSLFYGM